MIARRPAKDFGPVENDRSYFLLSSDFLYRMRCIVLHYSGQTLARSVIVFGPLKLGFGSGEGRFKVRVRIGLGKALT